jgi:1-acyl-sn-glycerol-3-phosphate acyltransferase
MTSARRYIPRNSRFFTWLIQKTYGAWTIRVYNAKPINLELFDTLKPPFILIGNHSTLLDPFLSNTLIPYPISWVTSDGNMRSTILRFLLLKLVGSIPKSKAIPDIETVNWIVQIIRKRKGVVGIYPEGQSSWNGTSIPSYSSTAKLFRMLKVPVILAKTRGAYMSKPRWSYLLRRGRVEIEFSVLFSPEKLKTMPLTEIDLAIDTALYHDDPEWSKKKNISFISDRRAEKLELALYACPSCGALASLESSGSKLTCNKCGFKVSYSEQGSFSIVSPGRTESGRMLWIGYTESRPSPEKDAGSDYSTKDKIHRFFADLKEWDGWQESYLEEVLRDGIKSGSTEAIFSDRPAALFMGKRMDAMRWLGRGSIELYSDRLVFNPNVRQEISFALSDIEGPGVLKRNFFEFYSGKTVFRVKFRDKSISGRKYAVALNILLKMTRETAFVDERKAAT